MDGNIITSPLVQALTSHSVSCNVIELNHRRTHGVAVETNYIIELQSNGNNTKTAFSSVRISKTYHEFRTLAKELREVINHDHLAKGQSSWESLSQSMRDIFKLLNSLTDIIDSEGTSYLGKVNFSYVKYVSKKRKSVINDALMMITTCFPSAIHDDPLITTTIGIIESFFLTGQIVDNTNIQDMQFFSINQRDSKDAECMIDDTQPNPRNTQSNVTTPDPIHINNHVFLYFIIFGGIYMYTSKMIIAIDLDLLLFLLFSFFSFGVQLTSRAMTNQMIQSQEDSVIQNIQNNTDFTPYTNLLLLKSMGPSNLSIVSENSYISSNTDCIAQPPSTQFYVRGGRYLTSDKKKIKSGSYLFPLRGADLYLTDESPENVGSNPEIFDGKLRDVPTFIINFRLPWGIFIVYHEIPQRFLPFLRKRYGKKISTPSKKTLSPAERSLCRFLMGDDKQRKQLLKMVPVIVSAPKAIQSVIGNKPTIIGNQISTQYVYEPPDESCGKCEYLELDLDVVSSPAARKILSVCKSYAKSLIIDIGFVIQGNASDELPEQMLTGIRLHGIDPITAPAYKQGNIN